MLPENIKYIRHLEKEAIILEMFNLKYFCRNAKYIWILDLFRSQGREIIATAKNFPKGRNSDNFLFRVLLTEELFVISPVLKKYIKFAVYFCMFVIIYSFYWSSASKNHRFENFRAEGGLI